MPDRAGRAFRKEQALKPLYTMIGTAAIKGKVRCLGAPSPRRRDVLGMAEARARAEMEAVWRPKGIWVVEFVKRSGEGT